MSTQTMSQIQLEIDSQTKKRTQKILKGIGLDLNSAIRMMCKQIVNTGFLPFEQRDEAGFRPHKAQELREASIEAHNSKGYTSVKELMKDLIS